jgi:DNA repair exonuclease SbcCD ATPase subunit
MNEEDNFLNEMKKAYDIRDSELESKFKTMLFTYRNALGMLSALNDEFNAITNNLNDLDINILINRYKPVLDKANDLLTKIEDLDDEMKNHSDMKAYLSSIKSHNIDTWVRKLDEVKYQIIKAKENEIRRQREAKEAEERRRQELQRQRNEESKRQAELERQREAKRQVELERQQREEIITFNGLMWEKETRKMNWHEAMEYAKNLRLGGYDNWRLPTKEELGEVIQSCKRDTGVIMGFLGRYGNFLQSKGFIDSFYWSSTSFSGMTNNVWVVDFGNGYVYGYYKDDNYCLRCVRAG